MLSEYQVLLPKVILNSHPAAAAQVLGDAGHPDLKGQVLFYPFQNGSLLLAAINGLPETGFFGFHVHAGGVCEGDFTSAEGHYNPTNAEHPNHAGDLPVLLSAGGFAYLMVYTNRFVPAQVIGRTVIIHAMADDYRSQPSGDSGVRIGCGVIKAM